MLQLDIYAIDQKIADLSEETIYRGKNTENNDSVIIKILNNTRNNQLKIKFKREFEFTHNIQSPDVVKSFALVTDKNVVALIQEDFGGESLKTILLSKKLSLNQILKYAVEICEVIEKVHQLGIIHKNINPVQIIVNEKTSKIKLTGFDIAMTQKQSISSIDNLNKIVGNLSYISPEQTGRINRIVDYRTDFYSFGVTLYEMLTGQLPFITDDPLALIHSHLAIEPIPPQMINLQIPEAVSSIVMKLLAKSADDRYQSAVGIIADLKNCLQQLNLQGKVETFKLATQDVIERFIIPQKLYGREKELEILLKKFENCCRGEKEVMLVTGYSGIGKTALIHEIDKSFTLNNALFASGKFDQYLRHIPYSAVINAFKGLIRNLLSENEEKLQKWKQEIKESLGGNVPLMLGILSDLTLLISSQEELKASESINAREQQDRINLSFIKLLQVFAKKEHPLVFFLDDLQWIDTASLQLMQKLIKSEEIQYCYFIGAYRSNEVDNLHPLAKILDSLIQEGIPINKMTLTPLDLPAVETLISDTVHKPLNETVELADIVISKTEGNPFFLIQFLMMLNQNNLIRFDFDRMEWNFDIREIKNQNITDNVIELMTNKLTKLPLETQNLLSLAACLGHDIDLQTLSIVNEKTTSHTYQDVLPAIKEGYLIPISMQELSSENLLESSLIFLKLKFLHDRVQQAAYALTPKKQQLVFHLKIAKLLLKNLSDQEKEERLFEIVDHLNHAEELIEPADKGEWRSLNLRAAIKAKQAAAYENALYYLKKGMAYIDYQEAYSEVLSFYRERIDLEFLNGNFEASQFVFREVLQYIKTDVEKCEFYITPISQLIFLSKFKEAIALAREALQHIDIEIPVEGTKQLQAAIIKEKEEFEKKLGNRTISSLINLPELTDQKIKLALAILTKVSTSVIYYDRPLYSYLCLKRINFCLTYGNDRLSSGSYASYGIAAAGFWDQYVVGAESCELAVKLSEKYNDQRLKTVALAIRGFTMPWVKTYKESISVQEESIQLGIASGELQYGLQNVHFKVSHLFFSGVSLDKVGGYGQEALHLCMKYKFQIGAAITQAYQLIIHNLQGLTKGRLDFYANEGLNEEKLIKMYTEHKIKYAETTFNLLKAISYFLYGENEKALESIQKIPSADSFPPGVVVVAQYVFYQSLIFCALFHSLNDEKKGMFLKQLENNIGRLEIWEKNCPENFSSLCNLVKAEKARLEKNNVKAIELYSQSVKSAEANGLIQQAALANELHGRFWLSLENKDLATALLEKARQLYLEWNAHSKAKWMLEEYSDIFSNAFVSSMSSSSEMNGNLNIDLGALLKSSQAISSEISLSRLIQKLLLVLVENVGAQRGVLILKDQDKWFIEGEYDTGTAHTVNILKSIPLTEDQNLPLSVIQLVQRTKETAVVINASSANEFANDPYVKKVKAKSILCAPILHHVELTGILYFENNLSIGTFTPERLEVLNILSAQIAISIENAKLYKSFEAFVPKEFLANLEKKSVINVKPGDYTHRDMTVMFSDIRDFTSMSERMNPEEVFALLNQILVVVNPGIKNNKGFIDKYLGDGIMALFESPGDAIRAGITMSNALEAFNNERKRDGKDPIKLGMGLNRGKLMLGIIGVEGRFQGDVLADCVNLTSRLESLTKYYGSNLIVSEAVIADNQNFPNRFLGKVAVKGKVNDVKIYEILEAETKEVFEKKMGGKKFFEDGLACYLNKKFPEACVQFNLALNIYPEDKAAKLYLKNCANFMLHGIPDDWDGTEIMKGK